MRVVLNNIIATEGGVLTVIKQLRKELEFLALDNDIEFIYILAGRIIEESPNSKIIERPNLKKSKLLRVLFEYVYGRFFINSLKPDLYISLNNTATIGVKCKQIVYLQQPLPFQNERNFSFFVKEERKIAFYQKIVGFFIKNTLKKSKADIVVQTRYMEESVKKKMGNKVKVIQPMLQDKFVIQKESDSIRQFIYPASDYIYKNHELIYKACNILNKRGIKDFKVILTIDKPLDRNVSDNCKFYGKISHEEVINLYSSSVLLFPSYIETYGLPLAEAKNAEARVFFSNTGFANEILKNYMNCFSFDKNDEVELAHLMEAQIKGNLKINYKKKKEEVDNYYPYFSQYIKKVLVDLNV